MAGSQERKGRQGAGRREGRVRIFGEVNIARTTSRITGALAQVGSAVHGTRYAVHRVVQRTCRQQSAQWAACTRSWSRCGATPATLTGDCASSEAQTQPLRSSSPGYPSYSLELSHVITLTNGCRCKQRTPALRLLYLHLRCTRL